MVRGEDKISDLGPRVLDYITQSIIDRTQVKCDAVPVLPQYNLRSSTSFARHLRCIISQSCSRSSNTSSIASSIIPEITAQPMYLLLSAESMWNMKPPGTMTSWLPSSGCRELYPKRPVLVSNNNRCRCSTKITNASPIDNISLSVVFRDPVMMENMSVKAAEKSSRDLMVSRWCFLFFVS
jgi:hypothetical protein